MLRQTAVSLVQIQFIWYRQTCMEWLSAKLTAGHSLLGPENLGPVALDITRVPAAPSRSRVAPEARVPLHHGRRPVGCHCSLDLTQSKPASSWIVSATTPAQLPHCSRSPAKPKLRGLPIHGMPSGQTDMGDCGPSEVWRSRVSTSTDLAPSVRLVSDMGDPTNLPDSQMMLPSGVLSLAQLLFFLHNC